LAAPSRPAPEESPTTEPDPSSNRHSPSAAGPVPGSLTVTDIVAGADHTPASPTRNVNESDPADDPAVYVNAPVAASSSDTEPEPGCDTTSNVNGPPEDDATGNVPDT
jgi:hypothetical protein